MNAPLQTQKVRTTCNRDCPDACSILVTVENGRATHLGGDPEHPVTQGFLCHRTSHFLSTQYSERRLTTPLLRSKVSGKLLPVSWQESLDFVASELLRFRKESGPESIFFYRSGGTLGMMSSVVESFWEHFGPITMKRGDICSGAGDAAQIEDFGIEDSSDFFDLRHAKSILLWGKNPFVASPHLLPLLKECRQKGAKLVLIDPVCHKTAAWCDDYIQVRPGGDFALAMAATQLLFDENRLAPDVDSYCDHVAGFGQLAHSRSLADWLAEADVTEAQVRVVADLLTDHAPATILVGWGMGRKRNGAAVVRALDALAAVTGNLGVAGAGVSFYYKRKGAFDTSFVKGNAPRTICEPLFGKELLSMSDPPIRAVWVMCGNPVVMLPDSNTTAASLRSRELLVVCDHNLTDTAELAHVVFPTTTLLESDDLLGSYGHHYLSASRPVIAPPKEVKADLQIIQELAARVGLSHVVEGTATEWKERMIAPKLGSHNITLKDLENGAVRNPLAPPVLFSERTFATPSGKVNLVHEMPPSPSVPNQEYPLLLMALSSPDSQCSQWVKPDTSLLEVTVHPQSACGIPDGGLGVLQSALGSMNIVVRHDSRQRKDVAIAPKGGHLRDGRCANALVEAVLTDLGEGGALFDQPVRLSPIT